MPAKFQNKYRIPSARAEWYDYNEGLYFITICTKEMKHYFGKIENDEMIYNEIGECANNCIVDIPLHFADAEIIISQVMPNHIHLIVEIQKSNKNIFGSDEPVETMHASSLQQPSLKNENCDVKMQNISKRRGRLTYIIGSFKSAVTKYTTDNNIEFSWQTRFHDRIIRSQDELERIYDYIQNNVTAWNNDRFYSQLP